LKGNLTIGKVYCSKGDNYVSIRIEDEKSSIQFLEIDISLEGIANAIFGASPTDCEFNLRNTENVGKKREIKSVNVRVPDNRHLLKEKDWAKLAEPFEVDGWIGHHDDLDNSKNKNRDGTFRMRMTRFVEDTNDSI